MWHPDRNTHTVDLARRKFEEVKIALEILSNETIRRQYDLKQFESVEGVVVPARCLRLQDGRGVVFVTLFACTQICLKTDRKQPEPAISGQNKEASCERGWP